MAFTKLNFGWACPMPIWYQEFLSYTIHWKYIPHTHSSAPPQPLHVRSDWKPSRLLLEMVLLSLLVQLADVSLLPLSRLARRGVPSRFLLSPSTSLPGLDPTSEKTSGCLRILSAGKRAKTWMSQTQLMDTIHITFVFFRRFTKWLMGLLSEGSVSVRTDPPMREEHLSPRG